MFFLVPRAPLFVGLLTKIMFFMILPYQLLAQENITSSKDLRERQAPESARLDEASEYTGDKSDFFVPFLSFLLPGYDQWFSGQYSSAFLYSSAAAIGWYAVYHQSVLIEQYEAKNNFHLLSRSERSNRRKHEDIYRRLTVFGQIPLMAGSYSAYQSFHDAVKIKQKYGHYKFLQQVERPEELAFAPFSFSYLKRPTTFLPLAFLTLLVSVPDLSENQQSDRFSVSDAFYTSAISYNAGTNEEVLFRGWLMPYAMETTDSLFWSNFAQSALFAGAHLNWVEVPLFQFGLGFYLGWLTQRSHWTLSESIFIHTWWDVIAFVSEYQIKSKDPASTLRPSLRLPPFQISF